MAFDNSGPAFRVKCDVVDGRTDLAGRVVLSPDYVLEESAQELRRPLRSRTSARRSADTNLRQLSLDRFNLVVVQLVVLLRRGLPIRDVRLVPHLPVPAGDLVSSVAVYAVLYPLVHQLGPF